jgi:predicted YcjX-like family ATPase
MPGDLAASPALTFAPLDVPSEEAPPRGSLWAMMERRYEAYKDIVVRPFFRDHFARLDRQIVLVDALAALNAGQPALRDLEAALTAILQCFRSGRRSWLAAMFYPRIDRILFAATKADHLHHTSHDRIERILARMTQTAMERAQFAGARIDVIALAAVRATREAVVKRGREKLPSIVGVPAADETAGTQIFDGKTEAAMFPGDLPEDPDVLLAGDPDAFRGLTDFASNETDFRFLRFRPPAPEFTEGGAAVLPHIRLDRALEFLLGDYLA